MFVQWSEINMWRERHGPTWEIIAGLVDGLRQIVSWN